MTLHKSRHEAFSNGPLPLTSIPDDRCPLLLLATLFGMCAFRIFHTLSMEPVHQVAP